MLGWFGTAALAMGGSNQMLFILGAVVASQGTAAVPLLVGGLVLSWAALPGWTELIMMWPKRVGGISATCAEAFRPYSPVLANLTGVCYWWGWIPTCGLTAILSASALHEWYLPFAPVPVLATGIVLVFTAVNLMGVKWAARVAMPIALASAALALLSVVVPVLAGTVDWQRASSFHLELPFDGAFGALTSAMAGLYLIGFAAPAFEAAACHVGETKDPEKNVPRAMFAAAGMATLYFLVLPVVWLGALGGGPIGGELMQTIGPTYAPLLGAAAQTAAIWFMVINMFHGTLQPLAGAARTLFQLSEDGLLPRVLMKRSRRDVPWVATWVTALMAIAFLQSGNPPSVIAAANFCYLIGICLPSLAVFLLRRNAPEMERPYRAPRGTVTLGAAAAVVWLLSTVLGLEQFGLPTVLFSLALAYSGSVFYFARRYADRRREQIAGVRRSLHLKLTGAMVAVMVLDGAGYLLAVSYADQGNAPLVTLLQDIFVAVAILTVTVGLVLPGMIAHAAEQVAAAAQRLTEGTIADLTRAMRALGRGDLERAHARQEVEPVIVHSRDEVGAMADSFNEMQVQLGRAAVALDGAREGLSSTEAKLERNVAQQAAVAMLGQHALEGGDLAGLMHETVDVVAQALGLPIAAIFELEPDERHLSVRAAAGHLGATAQGVRIPLLRDVGDPDLLGRDPLIVERLNGGPTRHIPELLREAGAVSGVSVPIHGRGGSFGVLTAHATEERTFAPDQIDFLQAVANVLADAVERSRAEDEMRHNALHDPLTGLPNRTLFVDRLAQALAQCQRRGTSVAVLFLDLDQFKLVNDSLGHAVGDELLQVLASRLDEALRPGDTVARFGGDEFLIISDDLRDASEAGLIAERTLGALSRSFAIAGGEHYVSASIGIAVAEGVQREPEDLIREADAAMYRSKERGPGNYERYDEAMRARSLSRLNTESELRRALEGDELRVHYQPMVALETARVLGVEALVRWEHPERGLLPPADFITVAEETGLILPLGEWVLNEACRQAATWHAERPGEPPLGISVNVSSSQVGVKLPALVAQVLEETGLAPSALSLEVTESVLVDDAESTMQVLRELKALGLKLVLDDFGTGYSSLAYVKRFPIDVLKIDRSFVSDIGTEDHDTTIVEAIISMARGLRVGVIAEGVETPVQASALQTLGCTLAQGYYYARPMPADELALVLDGPLPAAVATA
ncbi:MAG: hypothetical protein QOD71_522 [Thermoleophilaceae bacterium]|nr:hypothetical protein [Thermoleophilaceae bacterium]